MMVNNPCIFVCLFTIIPINTNSTLLFSLPQRLLACLNTYLQELKEENGEMINKKEHKAYRGQTTDSHELLILSHSSHVQWHIMFLCFAGTITPDLWGSFIELTKQEPPLLIRSAFGERRGKGREETVLYILFQPH